MFLYLNLSEQRTWKSTSLSQRKGFKGTNNEMERLRGVQLSISHHYRGPSYLSSLEVYTFKQFFLMFSLSNFKLKEMGNRNLLGILSSPIKRLCWWCKHTSSQIETALLCAAKTGNVLEPIFEQNPSSVFSAALHRSHWLQHSANCLIQVFNISEFQHFLYISTGLSRESCLLLKIFPNSENYCTSNTFTFCFYTWGKISRKPGPKNK